MPLTEIGQGLPLFAADFLYHVPEGGFRGVELVVLHEDQNETGFYDFLFRKSRKRQRR